MAKRINQHELNLQIAKFLEEKERNNESFSSEEKTYISQYEGKGGQGKHGATGEGVLNQFFTPDWLCAKMWELAYAHGFDGGNVLEPSCGTGRLIADAPDKKNVVCFESDEIPAKITSLLYPEAKIHLGYFEQAFMKPDRFADRLDKKKPTTWLNEFPFSLVIGNPPYGTSTNTYSSHFQTPKFKQIENLFMYYGLHLLKKGGILMYLTSQNFIRSGVAYQKEKDCIGEMAELTDAYRLPEVFRFSSVPTDILVFTKK